MEEKKPIKISLIVALTIIVIIESIILIGCLVAMNNKNKQETKEKENVLNFQAGDLNTEGNANNLTENHETIITANTTQNNDANSSQIDWEEYPSDIDSQNLEWIFGEMDYSMEEAGEIHYKLMQKTIYSLSKLYEDFWNCNFEHLWRVIGDDTRVVDWNSNYARYCYPDNLSNDLSAKYTQKIKYSIAEFNEMYYEGNYDLKTLVKNQYEKIKDKNYYYEIPKILIMNGNNASKEEYTNNSRAKKIKVTVNGEKEYTFDLKDTNKVQVFDLNYKQNTIEKPVEVEVEVLETYSGEKSDDVYISDFQCAITSSIPQGR